MSAITGDDAVAELIEADKEYDAASEAWESAPGNVQAIGETDCRDCDGPEYRRLVIAIEHRRITLARCATLAAQGQGEAWQPMDTAPRDGTMLRLLVEFTEHATEDSPDPSPTIGANNFDNDGEDRWQFAGWCWSHDHFTEGKGEPVGWLPMLSAASPAGVPDGDRIDWMEANARSVSFGKGSEQGYWVHVQGVGYSGSNQSLRDAIDSARKAQAAELAAAPSAQESQPNG